MSIEVKIEDYCHYCKDFVVKDLIEAEYSYDGTLVKSRKHVLMCENYNRCKKIEKYIREAIKNAPKKKN